MSRRPLSAPGTAIWNINKILAEKLDILVILYLDDILIYSEDPGKGHVKAVRVTIMGPARPVTSTSSLLPIEPTIKIQYPPLILRSYRLFFSSMMSVLTCDLPPVEVAVVTCRGGNSGSHWPTRSLHRC
jgi:hypothetical protein